MINLSSVKLNKENNHSSVQIQEVDNKKIAIIGIGLRLPMAKSVNEFWSNISNGVDCVREISKERKRLASMMLKACGIGDDNIKFDEAAFIDDIDTFDYSFFNLSPKEASVMDPNQRIFLETAIHAMEDAGYGGNKLNGSRTGVYLGYGSELDYKNYIQKVDPDSLIYSIPGNIRPIIASRLSYIMNFRGPSMIVDTTCSSSLVATHLACRALREGECDTALVGGIQIHLMPYRSVKIGIESSNSRTNTFDNNSNGTGTGEGAVVMVLKTLNKAIEAKDHIYAVISGSAVNHDGSSIGITAPNAIAQEDVIIRAWEDAEVKAESISYIEAHGTGTKLGDPIEIDGLCRAFRKQTDKKSFCGIGALKSNIGHLDNSAGIAGLLKGVMVLNKKQIPPTLHFKKVNRNINFEESPFYVVDQLRLLEANEFPLRCGVSSFGLSGTNCHMVLEEWQQKNVLVIQPDGEKYLFVISAKCEDSFHALIEDYKNYLIQNTNVTSQSLSYTVCTGRGHYEYRLAIIFSDIQELLEKITDYSLLTKEQREEQNIFYGVAKNLGENTLDIQQEKNNDFYVELCKAYITGADINFEAVFQGRKAWKISLPVYPFKKSRCWLDVDDFEDYNQHCEEMYTMSWCRENNPEKKLPKEDKLALVFTDGIAESEELEKELNKQKIDVILVQIGENSKEYSNNKYEIKCEINEFSNIFRKLSDKHFDFIIYYANNKQENESKDIYEFECRYNHEVNGVLYMTKAMLDNNIDYPIDLVFLAHNVNEVSKVEKFLDPLPNSLFGLGKVIEAEYPNITARAIDLDENSSFEHAVTEIRNLKKYYLTVFRNDEKYIEKFDVIQKKHEVENGITIKVDNVYIITGGTGGIGLEIANFLSKKAKVTIVLLSRSAFPEQEKRNDILKSESQSKYAKKIRIIQDIENRGSKIYCYQVDVSNFSEINVCIEKIRSRFGKINGLIHSAGVAGNGFLIQKTETSFQSVVAPKIKGTWLLDKLTEQDNLDFMILFSSLNTLMGIPGQTDYTAGNSYLDAYSAYRNKKGKKTIVINWTSWKEVGMAYDNHNDLSNGILKAIDTKRAINIFEKVLSSYENRVIVGEINKDGSLYGKSIEDIDFMIQDNIKTILNIKTRELTKETKIERKTAITHQKLEYPQIEKIVTEIWIKVLGYDEIDVNSNFFQIGGDSIMINRVSSLLDDAFPDTISMSELFKYTTILSISKYIYQKHNVGNEKETLQKKENDSNDEDMKNKIAQMLVDAKENKLTLENALQQYLSMED